MERSLETWTLSQDMGVIFELIVWAGLWALQLNVTVPRFVLMGDFGINWMKVQILLPQCQFAEFLEFSFY